MTPKRRLPLAASAAVMGEGQVPNGKGFLGGIHDPAGCGRQALYRRGAIGTGIIAAAPCGRPIVRATPRRRAGSQPNLTLRHLRPVVSHGTGGRDLPVVSEIELRILESK